MSRATGPRQGARPTRRRASAHGPTPNRPARLGRWAAPLGAAVVLVAVLVASTLAYVLWTLRDLPDPGAQGAIGRSVVVLDRSGKQIEDRGDPGEYHEVVAVRDMGRLGPAATLAAEDRNFYHHGAIDPTAMARSVVVDLGSKSFAQGGSTITQQLIKLSSLTPQKSIFRKLQEAVLAIALEQRYSKEQVLEMYLNRVYYGNGAYGLGAATKTYFGAAREPRDLTIGQAALLAGIINAPVYYDPITHYDRAKQRQAYVLRQMVATGAITQAQADQAGAEDLRPQFRYDPAVRRSGAPHFVDFVIAQLERRLGSAAVEQGGLAVTTTLDLSLQASAQAAVRDGVARLSRDGVNNADLMAVSPSTGEILAWVGSANYYDSAIAGPFDVLLAPRQPGSSFKPYVVLSSLHDRTFTLASAVSDRPTDFGGYRPLDFDNAYRGDMTVRQALLQSRNVPLVQMAQKDGMSNVIAMAHSLGIRSELQPGLATAIGASEVTMYEQVQAYQAIANQGTQQPLIAITRVTDSSGAVLFSQVPGHQAGSTRPISPAEAYLVTDVLKGYNQQWGLGWRRTMAGKSGTTGGAQVGVHPDAWMMAYSPDIVIGAWAGNTAPNGGGKPVSAFGTEVGQTVMAEFINSLPPSMNSWYRQPDGVVTGSGCPGSRLPGGTELFLAGTQSGIGCPAPSPSPSPSPSPTTSARPSPVPSTTPIPVPIPVPVPSPSSVGTPAPTPSLPPH